MNEAPGLLCVHAHPDDESIATGGVLAAAADRGMRTAVVTCTGGELGEIVGEGLDAEEIRPRLAEVRKAELSEALGILGAGEPRLLGYRDSGMMGTEGNEHPESFWRADFDEAVGRLVAQIRSFKPDVVVAYDAFGGYGHPDHIQTHRVGMAAIEAADVAALYPQAGPAWRVRKAYQSTIPKSVIMEAARTMAARGMASPFPEADDPADIPMGTPDSRLGAVVDVRAWLDRKMAALRAHYSQLGPDSFFLNIPDELQEAAFGREWFIRVRSDVAVSGREDDLFAGLDTDAGSL